MAEEAVKYDAFISYRHCSPDKEIAEKLHKALENYRLPHAIAKKVGRRKLERVFRDEAELAVSAELSAEIEKALLNSEYLIVICSPRLQLSEWCMKEIETFLKISDRNHILLVLAEGEPDESFPGILMYEDVEKTTEDGQTFRIREKREPLAGDCRGTTYKKRKEALKNTVLRLCAAMFGVRFDDLKNRQKERQMRTNGFFSGLIFLVVFCIAAQNTYFLIEQAKQNRVIQEKLATITASSSAELLEDGRRMDAIYVAKSVLPDNPEDGFNENAYRVLQNAMGIYSRPDLFKAELNIPVYPEYVSFNYDASLIASWNSQDTVTIYDSETGDNICTYSLKYGSEVEFYGKDSLLHYEDGKLALMNIPAEERKEIKIPKTDGDDAFKHLFITGNGEKMAFLLQDGIVYAIIDGSIKYKIDPVSLNFESGNSKFDSLVFSKDGKYAIAETYQFESGETASLVEFKTDTGEIISQYETKQNLDQVAPVENGFYMLLTYMEEEEMDGTEIVFFDNRKSKFLYNQFIEKEHYYDISVIGDTVTLCNAEKVTVMDRNLQVLNHMPIRHFPASIFEYQGKQAIIVDTGTVYVWDTEDRSFKEKEITSDKLEISFGDQIYLDENKFRAYIGGRDYLTVYKKSETDCLVEMKDYTYQDDYVEEDDAGLEKFAERISAQDGAPVMFKGITQDKKYYVLQAQDFQIRFYDIETEECVKKTYATDGTIWSVSYNEKYDCYFLDLYNWNENEVIIMDSELNYILNLTGCYLISTNGGIDGDPVIFQTDGNGGEGYYYSMKLLKYEEVMERADEILNGYVPSGSTLEKYGLSP